MSCQNEMRSLNGAEEERPILGRACDIAGRVQSVALRLVCEREADIERFCPQEYWTVAALLRGQNRQEFPARLVQVLLYPGCLSGKPCCSCLVDSHCLLHAAAPHATALCVLGLM